LSEKSKRRLEFSITAVFMLALLLVGAILIFSGGAASAKQFATLHLLGGQVDVQGNGSGDYRPGTEGAPLHEGDTIRTGSGGRAAIEYFDGSVTRLDHGTTFALVTLETLNNREDSRVIEGRQVDGNTYNRVADLTDPRSRFEVETPTATVAAQGTIYAVIVENGSTTVVVVDGVVKMAGDSGTVSVPAGSMAVVDSGGVVGDVQEIPQEVLGSPWLSYNLCDVDEDESCAGGQDVPSIDGPEPTQAPAPSQAPTASTEPPPSPPPAVTTPPGQDDGPPPPNQPPVAGFTASPDFGPAPLDVHFQDNSSDPDGDPLSLEWSFGDGASQSGGTSPDHTYDDPGAYTVTLTVSDPSGQTDTRSKEVNVGPPHDDEPPEVRITDMPPDPSDSRDASFTFQSSEEGTGFVCTLDGDSSPCGGNGDVAPVTGSKSYSDLSQGPHAFSVSMTDASGNTGADSYAWTIDTGGAEEPVFDHIVVSPSNATIQPGGSQNYTAEAFDTDGNSMGNVTADTSFSIAPNGSCTGNTCTANQPGTHTVTGTYSGDSDAATLVVEESTPPPCPNYALSFHTGPPSSVEAGDKFDVQVRVDVLAGGSSDGPLTISLSLSGGSFPGGDPSETWTGQGDVKFSHLHIDQPGSYAISASGPCASSPSPAPITVTEGDQDGTAVGLVLLPPSLFTALRRRPGRRR
jgi:PKD repeat protein